MVSHSPVQWSENVFLDSFTVDDVRMYRFSSWEWKLVPIIDEEENIIMGNFRLKNKGPVPVLSQNSKLVT